MSTNNPSTSPWQTARWHEDLIPVPNTSRKIHLTASGQARPNPPQKPLVVIAAGLGGVAAEHVLVSQLIAPSARVVRFDRAGYGASTRDPLDNPAESFTAASGVRDLTSVLDAVGLPPPYVLVGHSFGGVFIREFLRQQGGDKVAGMVFVDANPCLQREAFDEVDRVIAKLCGDAVFQDVIGLTRNCVLTPSQVEDVRRDRDAAMTSGAVQGEAEAADSSVAAVNEAQGIRVTSDAYGHPAAVSFEKKPLGAGRMSIIVGGFPDDFARAVEYGKENRLVDDEVLRSAEEILERSTQTWVPFHEAQGQLTSGEVRVLRGEGTWRTHNLHMTRPDVVAGEVMWVLEGWADRPAESQAHRLEMRSSGGLAVSSGVE